MGIFCNGANCDIYIGKGAGKKLMGDIHDAQKSIKIISPYLSPYLITELIYLNNKGIDIQLITVDEIEDYKNGHDKNIYKLIKQHTHLDEEAQNLRNKWIKNSRILLFCMIFLIIVTILGGIYLNSIRALAGFLPALVLFLAYYLLKKKIKYKRIYNYNYSQLFPFKVYMSPQNHPHSETFIHSKIYLIDDSIAYMGSLNFTYSGTKHNYETRIRTTEREVLNKLKSEFFDLFYHADIPERETQSWGTLLYREPIN